MATTPQEVWQLLGELAQAQKETERRFQETDRRFQESDRRFQETERILKEQSQRLNQELGQLGNRLGEFIETRLSNNPYYKTLSYIHRIKSLIKKIGKIILYELDQKLIKIWADRLGFYPGLIGKLGNTWLP